MRVSGLNLHPVKSLRALPVDALDVDSLGPVGDRRFLVVDPTGRFLSQRTVPAMARVSAAIDENSLFLRAQGVADLQVGRHPDPAAPIALVSIWKSEGLSAEDCGDPAAAWLSGVLSTDCRLVRAGSAFHRPVTKPGAADGDVVGFPDSCAFLVISEASLADLNGRLQSEGLDPLPMNRFRPNLVVEGCDAFAEDTWKRFRIGDVVFRAVGPCARCGVTTTDQTTGDRGVEPLRTLAMYRRDAELPSQLNFGQNLINESKRGRIRVGDPVVIL